MLKTLKKSSVLGMVFALCATGLAAAAEYKKADITVEAPWLRAKAAGAKVVAGYAHIINNGDKDEYLTGVSSPIAKKIKLHEMKMVKNVMSMHALRKPILIKAHSDVSLKPGGYHIMFMNVKKPVEKGTEVPASFLFKNVGAIDVKFAVADVGATKAPDAK